MTYLYIDESGDLGFGKRGSEYFIICCVKIDDDKTNMLFQRIPKKVRQRKLSKKLKKTTELKFSNSSVIVRNSFLKRVAALDVEIYSLIIKKDDVKSNLRNNLPIFYNFLIKILIENPLKKTENNHNLLICLDKCMSQYQRIKFEGYIQTEFFSIFREIPVLKINHDSSESNYGLQVTDFVIGAFGYKYNRKKMKDEHNKYTNIIRNKIVLEKNDLFNKKY